MKKLKIQMNGRSDEFGTPKVAWDILKPYIKEDWTIWESAWGKGELGEHMIKDGFEVVGTPLEEKEKWDFFIDKPIQWDCIITNPPYSIKEKFLRRCFELETPFALLMPLTALEGKKRGELYRKFGIQFQPVANGAIYNNPSYDSIIAAKYSLEGKDSVGDSLYFLKTATAASTWITENREYYTTVGNHAFYL